MSSAIIISSQYVLRPLLSSRPQKRPLLFRPRVRPPSVTTTRPDATLAASFFGRVNKWYNINSHESKMRFRKNLSSIFSVAIIDAHFYKEQTNNNKHKHLWQILLAKEWFSIHQRPWCRAASRLRFEICPGQQNTNRPGRMRHCNFTITNT